MTQNYLSVSISTVRLSKSSEGEKELFINSRSITEYIVHSKVSEDLCRTDNLKKGHL